MSKELSDFTMDSINEKIIDLEQLLEHFERDRAFYPVGCLKFKYATVTEEIKQLLSLKDEFLKLCENGEKQQ